MNNTNNIDYTKFNLVSIDAWRDYDNSWYWNNHFIIENDIVFLDYEITPRKIAKALRKWGFLTEQSKGRIVIDMSCEECIEIRDKNTFEPLLALSTLHG